MLCSALNAQTILNIHQSNGTVQQIPTNTIDSITYSSIGGNGIVSNPGQGVTFNGVTYSTIVLGNGQEWMGENIRTSNYANGDTIPNISDPSQWVVLTTGAWVYYDNDSQYENTYGKLYNWYAVSDPRNICPQGWRVPTETDWSTLINYLDPNAMGGANFNNFAGGKMKSIGTQYWINPNTGASNESGFSGLPGGVFDSGSFNSLGTYGNWWGATEVDFFDAWYYNLYAFNDVVYKYHYVKQKGHSVRCIKN
jgi:uncharacterized protein (TIGR02145 family)